MSFVANKKAEYHSRTQMLTHLCVLTSQCWVAGGQHTGRTEQYLG